MGDAELAQLKGIAKASADLCGETTWGEMGTYYCLYTVGLMAHYYPVSFLFFSMLILQSRLKMFSKSCALLGMMYVVEQRLSLPTETACCSDLYFVATGAQTFKLLPALFLLLLGSRAFRDKSFTDSLDYAHSGQVAAFFQIFPSYALSLFDLFEQNLTLATFASLVLISAVTFGNYRSVMFLWLRRMFGRYCLVVGSFGLNLSFLYFDYTIRGAVRALCYCALREAWSVVASYEVECIYIEKQLVKCLSHGESCSHLLEESYTHPFLTLPPLWSRRRLHTRFCRAICKHADKIQTEDLVEYLNSLRSHDACASVKTGVLMLRSLLQTPRIDLFLAVHKYSPDYSLFLQPQCTFLECIRMKLSTDCADREVLQRIEEYLGRREANILFLVWGYQKAALGTVQRVSWSLFRDMTYYIA